MAQDRGVPGRRTVAIIVLALCTAGVEFALGVAGNLASNDLADHPGRWSLFVGHPFIAAAVLIVASIVGVFLWRSADAPAPETDLAKAVDATVETLAVRLRESWSEEASLRLVDRPRSLPVAWVDEAGERGTIDDIAFDRTGRLVVLGGRGARGRVLPVLDGLDEMAGELRAEALRVLSSSLREADEFLLTSRSVEYSAAARAAGALPGTRVIALQDLEAPEPAKYLDGDDWADVIGEPALREALNTPLTAFLARKVAESGRSTPREMAAIGDATAIRQYLMREFVPAVYGEDSRRAERYLRFLARHLAAANSSHLRWWEMTRVLTDGQRALLGVGFGLGCTLVTNLIEAPLDVSLAAIDGASFGAVAGLLAAATIGRDTVLGRRISPLPVRIGGRRRRREQVPPVADRYGKGGVVGFGLRLAALVGVASGLLSMTYSDVPGGYIWPLVLINVFSTGVPVALAAGFATWLSRRIEAPVGLGRVVGPLSLLRLDRSAAWIEAGLYGGAAAVLGSISYAPTMGVVLLAVSPLDGNSIRVSPWDTSAILDLVIVPAIETTIFVVLLLPFLLTAWGRFVLVRAFLGVTGKLPLRLRSFLADAHRRGVLRQAGPVYQFRHIAIRDALARQ